MNGFKSRTISIRINISVCGLLYCLADIGVLCLIWNTCTISYLMKEKQWFKCVTSEYQRFFSASVIIYVLDLNLRMFISTVTDSTASRIFSFFYVIDMSFIQPVFDIAPQAKVERSEIWRPVTSTSNPDIYKHGRGDKLWPAWRLYEIGSLTLPGSPSIERSWRSHTCSYTACGFMFDT